MGFMALPRTREKRPFIVRDTERISDLGNLFQGERGFCTTPITGAAVKPEQITDMTEGKKEQFQPGTHSFPASFQEEATGGGKNKSRHSRKKGKLHNRRRENDGTPRSVRRFGPSKREGRKGSSNLHREEGSLSGKRCKFTTRRPSSQDMAFPAPKGERGVETGVYFGGRGRGIVTS